MLKQSVADLPRPLNEMEEHNTRVETVQSFLFPLNIFVRLFFASYTAKINPTT
jgi:hypothetical protein